MVKSRELLISLSKYTAVTFAEKGLNYGIFFMMTYFISPDEFGILSLYMAIFAFVSPFVHLSASGAAMIAYQHQKEDFKSYFASCFKLNIRTFALVFLVFSVIAWFLGEHFDMPFFILLLIPIIAYLDSVKFNYLAYTQIAKRIRSYSVVTISYGILCMIVTFIFLKFTNFGYVSRIMGYGIPALIVAIYIYRSLQKANELAEPKKEYVKDAFMYGIALVPHAIGQIIIDLSDRFFIKIITNRNDELGFYSTAYTITAFLGIIAAAFFASWVPHLNSFLAEKTDDSLKKVVKVHSIYLAIFLIITISLIFISPFLFKYFINSKYFGAVKYIPYLAFTLFFQSVYNVFALIIFYTKKNIYFLYASIVNISSNITLNYIFITKYGAIGAAYATLISTIIFSSLILYFSNKIFPLPWKFLFKK